MSFATRRAALLLSRGATVGALTDGTVMVSLRLCPGTPSKIAGFEAVGLPTITLEGLRFAGVGAGCPMRNAAARVMRGATAGGAVEATGMVPERLWPGTLANVLASCALESGARGATGFFSTAMPARRAAARVVRGTMSGASWVFGRGLARKKIFLAGLDLLPLVE